MTLLFADDQPVALAGLRALVADDRRSCEHVTDPREVVRRAVGAAATMVIAGFFWSTRGRAAFEVVHALRRELPELPLLIRAPHDDPHLRIGLQRLGASGLIATNAPLEHLGQAVVAAYNSGLWFTPIPAGTPLLTTRDLRMLQALDAGAGHKELAARLTTSRTAIDKRLARLRTRFGFPSTTSLVAWMVERGLAHLPPETLGGEEREEGEELVEEQDSRTAGQPMIARPTPSRNPELCELGGPPYPLLTSPFPLLTPYTNVAISPNPFLLISGTTAPSAG